MRYGPAVVVLVAASLAVGATTAQAATFVVTSTADTVGSCPSASTCTLRAAVAAADGAAGNDTIAFAVPANSVISLTSGPLVVNPTTATDETTIAGPGANTLTVRRDPGAAPTEVLHVGGGSSAAISGLTISGGLSSSSAAAMYNLVPLTLDGVTVTANSTTPANGVNAGTILGLDAITLRNSTVSGNTIVNDGTRTSATALFTLHPASIINSTISGNVATGTGPGAAIAAASGAPITVLNSTISSNSATVGTGGIQDADSVSLANTILAGNTVAGTPSDCAGTPVSQGYNILGSNAGCAMVAATGDQIGTAGTPINPLLGPLSDNGGPTWTLKPLAGSPAIDLGNPAATSDAPAPAAPALVPCRTTDQRGVPRPVDARCDVGAVEAAAPTDDYPTVVLADLPAGYWRFDEASGPTALDSSPNHNDGSYLNGPLLGQAGAFAGSNTAVSFDGVNDLVRVPDSNSLDVGDTFSLEGWVKRTSTSSSQTLFSKGANGIQATIMNAANGNQVWLRKANVTTIAHSAIGVPADGLFHHVVITKNGTGAANVKIYIDGVESTVVVTVVQAITNTTFPLDMSGGAGNRHAFDEFALYDGALSAAQIGLHYATARP